MKQISRSYDSIKYIRVIYANQIIYSLEHRMQPSKKINKDQFLSSNQLKVHILSVEKKLMHRDKYIIEIVTDKRFDQIKKTYREFQYFSKILTNKFGNSQLSLNKSIRSNNQQKSLEKFIERLNNGMLLYKKEQDRGEESIIKYNLKIREIRHNFYTLCYQSDALFVDGVDDDSSESEQEQKKHKKSEELKSGKMEVSGKTEKQKNLNFFPIKKTTSASETNPKNEEAIKKTRQQKTSVINKNFLSLLRSKKKPEFQLSENISIKNILKDIKFCYLKCANNYKTRDRSKFFESYRWIMYQFKPHDRSIEFSNGDHRRILALHSFDIQLSFQHYTRIIVKNNIDKIPLQIRLDIDQDETQEVYERYLALYTYLKELAVKMNGKNVLNKVRLRLALKKNQKQSMGQTVGPSENLKQGVVKHINIKIVHGDLQTNSITSIFNLGFESFIDVDLPIIDHYGSIQMFFNEVKNQQGFLNNIGLMDSYSTLKLPVQTLYDYIYNQNKPKKKHVEAKQKVIELKNTKSSLQIQYKGIGNYLSYCTFDHDDIFEGDHKPTQFAKDEFRMHMNRLKRIVWTIQQYTDRLKDVKNFTYPNLSYLLYILAFLFVLMYDNNYMHIFFVLTLLLILSYNSPAFSTYFPQLIMLLNFKERYDKIISFLSIRNDLLKYEYTKVHHKVIRKAFLDQFELTRKNKRSIYKKYKRLAEILLRCQNLALLIVSVLEKIKNIFIWYHYEKTKLIFFCLLGLLFLFVSVNFRVLVIFFIVLTARKGLKYHRKVQDINRIVLTQVIRLIIEENQFNHMREFMKNPQKQLDMESPQTRQFFKKCRQTCLSWLDIQYQQKNILQIAHNMEDFIKAISKCKSQFLIRQEICRQYKFSIEWSKNDKTAAKLMKLIFGFIITVPSDKLIMGVKTVNQDDDEQDEMDEAHMGEILDF